MNISIEPKINKRVRLVEAADQLFHEQGVSTTTLANIALRAQVPLGNVYYYFKSKDSIVFAVIERRQKLLQQQFQTWDTLSDPKTRLQAFITQHTLLSEQTALHGDAVGNLCQELSKQGDTLANEAAHLLKASFQWCKKQFHLLGQTEHIAESFALNLLSGLQGMKLLTLSFREPTHVATQSQFLQQWIDSI